MIAGGRWVALAVAAVAAFRCQPAAAGGPGIGLVGFTAATFKGDVGLFTLHDACEDEFRRRARACSAGEAQTTTAPPALAGGPAWVTERGRLFVECAGWSSTVGTAATVDPSGAFARLSCNVARPVACCARR